MVEGVLVALDVGTSKVCALIGEIGRDGRLTVIGHGTVPSSGPEARRGREHRADRPLHPGRGRARRAAVRLEDRQGLRRRRRRAGRELQLDRPGVGRGPHPRGQPGRHPAGGRAGPDDPDPVEPRGPPRRAAGLHRRRPGGRQGPARDERPPARGRGPHRHGAPDGRPEPHEVRRPGRREDRRARRQRPRLVGGRRERDGARARRRGRGRRRRARSTSRCSTRARRSGRASCRSAATS